MTDSAKRSDKTILALVREVEVEAAGGAEALFMATMLAPSTLPYDFVLSVEGTQHNPSLINPAAAFFAATATIDPLITRDLVDIDADSQVFQLHDDVRQTLRENLSDEEQLEWAGRAVYGLNLILPDAEPQHWPTYQWLMPHIHACRELVTNLGLHTAAANRVLHQAGFSFYHQQRKQRGRRASGHRPDRGRGPQGTPTPGHLRRSGGTRHRALGRTGYPARRDRLCFLPGAAKDHLHRRQSDYRAHPQQPGRSPSGHGKIRRSRSGLQGMSAHPDHGPWRNPPGHRLLPVQFRPALRGHGQTGRGPAPGRTLPGNQPRCLRRRAPRSGGRPQYRGPAPRSCGQ